MTVRTVDDLHLSQDERRVLEQHGFDFATFSRLQDELEAGRFPAERNISTHTITPPSPADFTPLAEAATPAGRELEALGTAAIQRGEVAVAILNGGMATRFGGRVKGVVEVVDGQSFMALKLGDVARAPGAVPTFLMSSFATEAESLRHLEAHGWFGLDRTLVTLLTQRISVRLTPQGQVFRDKRNRIGFYAPGHGDVFEVLGRAAAFQQFKARGGRVVMVSNIDNLGATLCPRVVGAHLQSGRPVTVEVAPRVAGDKGGAPVRKDGHLEVFEGFRFPKSFDIGQVPVFNTNTLLVDVAAVRPDYPLTWFRADKEVEGLPVVQFERLMGEVTAFVDAAYLAVPRDGPEGRFLPVKTPDDLTLIQALVRRRFASQPG